MAATPADTMAATGGDAVVGASRHRGKSKAANFKYAGPMSVIRLELDATDERFRRRLEAQWEAVFRLRRALQRDAAARCRVYWASRHQRVADPKALRVRLGLTRKGMETSAKRHIEASGWMRDHLTKAVGLHVADEVWESIDRHLFADTTGRRQGAPQAGSWWDFTRIPGRARSHTKTTPTWETYRLAGTLDGHLATYRHPRLPAAITTAAVAATEPARTSILAQPARIPAPPLPVSKSWWDHHGAFAVVFTGLPAGDLVMPVRLPSGAGQWPHLHHFLASPVVWHKIDLVRVVDRKALGGWRYYAHLLVHQAGYQSPSTRAQRAQIPSGRRAGVDTNVSNLSIVSFPHERPNELTVAQIVCTPEQQRAAARAAKTTRDRQRALDRSRRNTNPSQYGPSVRQRRRAERRTAAGLPARQITNPCGARHSHADGRPLRAYRRDDLSQRYRRTRSDHATAARRTSQAKHARAAAVAAQIVAAHGNTITVEDCRITAWARLWGKRISLFSPGMLVAALADECAATGGRLSRASTRTTAMSQHCLCGARVPKTLALRVHDCPHCGLRADRDIVAATLATCVTFTNPDDPHTATVDYRLAHAARDGLTSLQEREGSVNRRQPPTPTGVGSARTGSHHPLLAYAEQAAPGPPPNRPRQRGRHGTSPKQPAPS